MSQYVLAAVDIMHEEGRVDVLKTAQRLAQMEGLPLAVVTVVPDFGMSMVSVYFDEDAVHKAVAEATQRLHRLTKETLGTDHNIKHVIRTGTAYEQILETAQDLEIALIVVGAHKPDYRDYLLGPTAARIVRHANCSVHVVRNASNF